MVAGMIGCLAKIMAGCTPKIAAGEDRIGDHNALTRWGKHVRANHEIV